MSDEKRSGPQIALQLSCFGCRYEQSSHYAVQGDSGCKVSCGHPDRVGMKNGIGDTSWTTPDWCPLRASTMAEFLKTEMR